jgi:hypothetical protein
VALVGLVRPNPALRATFPGEREMTYPNPALRATVPACGEVTFL